MAESSARLGKRKASSGKEKSSKKSKTVVDFKRCSLQSCANQQIDTQTDSYAEIKATPVEGFTSSVITLGPNGEAHFHKTCWDNLLKSSRARNPKNITIKLRDNEKSLIKDASKTVEYHDSIDTVRMEGGRIAKLIKLSKHCIIFSGAGISTAAGIGDYRGKEGKWTEEDREAESGCSTVVEEAGVPYETLRPTYTHEALVKLLEMGFIKHIISQNGDGLHGLSGVPAEKLSELHGNVFVETCESCCHRYNRSFYVLDDTASQYLEDMEENASSHLSRPKHTLKCPQCGINHRTGRKCSQKGCKGFLKDSIINFGDNLEESILSRAEENADKADLCLSLGTTMQVTPACDLVSRGQKPLRLVIVNRQKTGFDDLCFKTVVGNALGSRVLGDCDQVLAEVMKHLLTPSDLATWEGGRQQRLEDYNSQRS